VETTAVFSGLGIAPLVLIFGSAAAAVWVAGIHLSRSTDALDMRLGFGEALGGAVLLAIATNLPEIAITASAALAHDLGIAIGNILGGIAIQTVVLVVLDIAMGKESALTTRAASLVLGLEGLLVILVLAISVMGAQLPAGRPLGRVEPAALLIALCWLAGVWLVNRSRRGLPWHDTTGTAPGGQEKPMGHSKAVVAEKMSVTRAGAIFGAAAAVTLVAGIVLERSGERIANHVGLSGVLFGATILAAATALPEVSTGIASVKLGDFQLAVSDIFGGNAFLPVLFLLASVLSGSAVLPQAQPTDIYLTALGIVLTVVYGWGLITRPNRQVLRMGLDSLTVLVLYAAGIAGLIAVTNH
jgi:cation:H+ antiporter